MISRFSMARRFKNRFPTKKGDICGVGAREELWAGVEERMHSGIQFVASPPYRNERLFSAAAYLLVSYPIMDKAPEPLDALFNLVWRYVAKREAHLFFTAS